MVLYIARHGESLGNTGQDNGNDPVLSAKGLEQARLLSERMRKIKLDAVFSSPLVRAVQTANATARLQNKETEIISNLFEVENGETREQAYERALSIVEEIKLRFKGHKKVILFAHGTFNNYIINAAIGFSVRDDFNFCQENTGLSCIKFLDNGKVKVEFINDYCHLTSLGGIEY